MYVSNSVSVLSWRQPKLQPDANVIKCMFRTLFLYFLGANYTTYKQKDTIHRSCSSLLLKGLLSLLLTISKMADFFFSSFPFCSKLCFLFLLCLLMAPAQNGVCCLWSFPCCSNLCFTCVSIYRPIGLQIPVWVCGLSPSVPLLLQEELLRETPSSSQ